MAQGCPLRRFYYWYLRGQRFEGTQWLAHLLSNRRLLADDLRLAILVCFYSSAHELGDSQRFARYEAEFVQLLEECANKHLQASALYFIASSASDVSQAIVALERALALAHKRALGDLHSEGMTLLNLGDLYAEQGMKQEARGRIRRH